MKTMWHKPAFIVDRWKVENNIDIMLHKAGENKVVLRPHFKTHQSAEIGELFRKKGITKIAVSSVSMARFFAHNGWTEITIAFPVNINETDEINKLASEINLNLLVESFYSTVFLAEHLSYDVSIFIKIDTGYHRCGIDAQNPEEIDAIIKLIQSSEYLHFKGFLAHAGHTYQAQSVNEIIDIGTSSIRQLNMLKKKFAHEFPEHIISYGDTPSCSLLKDLSGVDEIRPGNFVYYDVMQWQLGSCNLDDIAVAVACPVVANHAERNELLIYGGAIHLSKEFVIDKNGNRNYGFVVEMNKNGWGNPIPGAFVKSLSQEHGIVFMPNLKPSRFKPGHIIGILPVHSCLTANLMKEDMYFL